MDEIEKRSEAATKEAEAEAKVKAEAAATLRRWAGMYREAAGPPTTPSSRRLLLAAADRAEARALRLEAVGQLLEAEAAAGRQAACRQQRRSGPVRPDGSG